MKANTKLNLEYSWAQGAYWASDGLIFNFAAVFLQSRGYSNYSLGVILALGNIFAFVLQPLVAGYIDRHNKKPLLRFSALIAVITTLLAVAAVFIPRASFVLSAAYVLILATNILLQPLTNSVSTYLGTWGYNIKFSAARGFGSLCFALCMATAGVLTTRVSVGCVPVLYIVLSLLLLAVFLLFIRQNRTLRAVPEKVFDNPEKASSSFSVFIKQNKRFCFYLVGIAMLFFSHSLQGNFLIEFLRPIGGDSEDMGNLLCMMALSELPAMFLFDRLLRKIRCSTLLKFSAIMFAVKQAALLFVTSVAGMYAAMSLQAVAFAILIPATVRYVEEVIKKRDSVKGQAFTTSMFTLGSIFASYFGGYMLDKLTVHSTLLVGTIVVTLGAGFILFSVEKTQLKH